MTAEAAVAAAPPPGGAARLSSWSAGRRCSRPALGEAGGGQFWHEDRQRRQCEAPTEQKLAIKLEKVTERLEADAPNMRRSGADLIAHYLDPGRLPVQARWSCKHAHTQGRLCAVYAAPVIAAVACQDIKVGHMQRIVNAAPTAGVGGGGRGMVSALVLSGEHSVGEGLRVGGRER